MGFYILVGVREYSNEQIDEHDVDKEEIKGEEGECHVVVYSSHLQLVTIVTLLVTIVTVSMLIS